jgi:uncharacterized protein YdeI (YjbR/CyaY-like superfamily)
MDDRELLLFEARGEWRAWLESHHDEAGEAWLVLYKKGVREGTLTLEEAVQEAVCFGWIDGRLKGLDDEKYSLRFSPRKAKSVWSISNIRRVEELIQAGLMTDAGLKKVAEGRESGQWEAAIRREQTDVVPPDLERALRRKKGAMAAYRDLPESKKKQYLHWIYSAVKPQTRERRIGTIVQEVGG